MSELYVTGVVIPNGVADHENDVLDKTDIKKIFTKYINRDTDFMHTRIKNKGVTVLANWISEIDREIDGKVAPAGSWLATLKITNENIIKSIKEGKIKGLSLGSVTEEALETEYWFINKSINYKDVDDLEEVIPLFISFVDLPSNQYGLEIEEYNVYINKRKKEDFTMSEKNDETISMGTLEKIANIFNIDKSQDEVSQKKLDDVKIEKEENGDISNQELLDALDKKIDAMGEKVGEAVVSAIEKLPDILNGKTDDETEIDKSTDKEEEDEETVDEKKDETAIDKRVTQKTESVEQPNKDTDFYRKSGRDQFGCRIKN